MSPLPTVAVVVGPDEEPPGGVEGARTLAQVLVVRTATELSEALETAQVVFAWDYRRPLLRDAWKDANALRWVHAGSTGVDTLLFPELLASDVMVTHTRGVFERSIAEYVLALLLLFAKDLETTLRLQRQRSWRHRETELLTGRRLLVVGVGPVGREIAKLARAVGMEVAGVGRSRRDVDPDFDAIGGRGDLDRMLTRADDVVIAAPLTPETKGMFDDARLAQLRSGARLINVGRGAIIDESALLDHVRSGHLGAVGLDVFDEEPLPRDHALWTAGRVVVSPHMSGDREGWRDAVVELFLENLRRWCAGKPLLHVVDKSSPSLV